MKLDPIIQTGIRDSFISMGHGRTLINVENKTDQLEIYETILKNKLSVRQTETLVQNFKKGTDNSVTKEKLKTPAYIKENLKEISTYFGHKVEVKVSSNNKGKIVIPFHSEEDFIRIKKLLE